MSAAESSSSRFLVQMMCKSYAVKIGQKQLRTVIIPHFSVGANLELCTSTLHTVKADVAWPRSIPGNH